MFTLRALWLSTLLSCVACQYDFNELYEVPDGGAGDGAGGGNGSARSSHLIGLWGNYPAMDDECIQCAETSCGSAEEACRADPECMEFTKCVAETPTPAGQAVCRARQWAWVTSNEFQVRDGAGPYGQCVFRDFCARECDGASDLSCVQNYAWPLTSEATVRLTLLLNDSEDLKHTLPGVTVKVCPEGDALCKAPTATGASDERGLVQLDLPTTFNRSFNGFIELQEANLFPTLLKFSWNIGSPTVQVVTMINKATFDFFSNNYFTFSQDPSRGILQTRMFGCTGNTTRGVKFASTGSDAETFVWYMENGLPSSTATETSSLGQGGTFNVLTGYQTVTATRASDGLLVGRANAPVRAGFATVVVFAPEGLQ